MGVVFDPARNEYVRAADPGDIADTSTATTANVGDKVNAILAALRDAQVI